MEPLFYGHCTGYIRQYLHVKERNWTEGDPLTVLERYFLCLQAGAFLRAAYEGKMDVVLKLIEEEGVPVSVENQVCGEVNIASYS